MSPPSAPSTVLNDGHRRRDTDQHGALPSPTPSRSSPVTREPGVNGAISATRRDGPTGRAPTRREPQACCHVSLPSAADDADVAMTEGNRPLKAGAVIADRYDDLACRRPRDTWLKASGVGHLPPHSDPHRHPVTSSASRLRRSSLASDTRGMFNNPSRVSHVRSRPDKSGHLGGRGAELSAGTRGNAHGSGTGMPACPINVAHHGRPVPDRPASDALRRSTGLSKVPTHVASLDSPPGL
jgi:hypothetical protein